MNSQLSHMKSFKTKCEIYYYMNKQLIILSFFFFFYNKLNCIIQITHHHTNKNFFLFLRILFCLSMYILSANINEKDIYLFYYFKKIVSTLLIYPNISTMNETISWTTMFFSLNHIYRCH
jgi:hypothetical protein